MARKLFISAGHGGHDPGALGGGYVEAELTIELRQLVVNELRKLGIVAITDPNRNALAQTLAWLRGKFGEKDILLDIHWNASLSPDSRGSEVIIPEQYSEFEFSLATALLKTLTDIGFRNRGVKPETLTFRKSLGWMRPNAENVLIEVCFITNASDMTFYQNSKNIIAKRLAYVLREYINK
jgi:N-acetylmuramoyl-L-alanine amidase